LQRIGESTGSSGPCALPELLVRVLQWTPKVFSACHFHSPSGQQSDARLFDT
jgi:hypothetical protein